VVIAAPTDDGSQGRRFTRTTVHKKVWPRDRASIRPPAPVKTKPPTHTNSIIPPVWILPPPARGGVAVLVSPGGFEFGDPAAGGGEVVFEGQDPVGGLEGDSFIE
jgi:hypothetical protein